MVGPPAPAAAGAGRGQGSEAGDPRGPSQPVSGTAAGGLRRSGEVVGDEWRRTPPGATIRTPRLLGLGALGAGLLAGHQQGGLLRDAGGGCLPPARSISSFIWLRVSSSSAPVMVPVTTTVIPASGRSAAPPPARAGVRRRGRRAGSQPGSVMLTPAATSLSMSGASSASSATIDRGLLRADALDLLRSPRRRRRGWRSMVAKCAGDAAGHGAAGAAHAERAEHPGQRLRLGPSRWRPAGCRCWSRPSAPGRAAARGSG